MSAVVFVVRWLPWPLASRIVTMLITLLGVRAMVYRTWSVLTLRFTGIPVRVVYSEHCTVDRFLEYDSEKGSHGMPITIEIWPTDESGSCRTRRGARRPAVVVIQGPSLGWLQHARMLACLLLAMVIATGMLTACSDDSLEFSGAGIGWCVGEICAPNEHCAHIADGAQPNCYRSCQEGCACCLTILDGRDAGVLMCVEQWDDREHGWCNSESAVFP